MKRGSSGGKKKPFRGQKDLIEDKTTDPLFTKDGDQYYFYHNDHLGTPQKLTAVTGAVVWSAKYSSFGEATIEVEAVENNLRFPGQYEDAETGLHYNWNRYYDPEIGRYLRADPVGLESGINLYTYARNNSMRWIDFSGLDCGSGPTEWMVPDKPAGYDFTPCCIKHDACYRGDNGQCWKDQAKCDDEFYDCMSNVCKGYREIPAPERPGDREPLSNKSECLQNAMTYKKAVEMLGRIPFCKGRKDKPCCNKPKFCH